MALPFEEQEGLPFEAQGLPFEEVGSLTLPQAQQQFKEMGPIEQAYEVAKGTGEQALEFLTGGAGAIGAVPLAAYDLARGEDWKTVSGAAGAVMEDMTYRPKSVGGTILSQEYVQPGMQKLREAGGEFLHGEVGKLTRGVMGEELGTVVQEGFEPVSRTLGEVGTDVAVAAAPLAALRGRKGVTKSQQVQMDQMLREAQETLAKLEQEQAREATRIPEFEREGLAPLEPGKPLEFTQEPAPLRGGVRQPTFEGQQALAQGPRALREGATEPLRMEALPYPVDPMAPSKPHLRGPAALTRDLKPHLRGPEAISREMSEQMTRRIVPDAEMAGEPIKGRGWNSKLADYQSGWFANKATGMIERVQATFREQLEAIRDESGIPYYKELAKLLLEDKKFNPRFETADIGTAYGRYQPGAYRVIIKPSQVGNEALTLHEAVHARTHGAIERIARKELTGTGKLYSSVRQLEQLYQNFDKQFSKEAARPYGLTNVHEFIAEAFTNPEFQALLARTPLPKGFPGRSYWDRFVDSLGRLLGLSKESRNYLSETLRTGAEIMAEAGPEIRKSYLGETLGPEFASFSDFKKELQGRGIKIPDEAAKAIYERNLKPEAQKASPDEPAAKVLDNLSGAEEIQRQYADRRPWSEVVPEIAAWKKDTLATEAGKNTIGKLIQGRFISKSDPLSSKVSSEIHWTKQGAKLQGDARMHGKSRKNPDRETFNFAKTQLKRAQEADVNDVGQALANEGVWLGEAGIQAKARQLLGRDLTKSELESYLTKNRIFKEVLKEFNALLLSEGRTPIHELPHYWGPAVFDRPFRVRFMDKATGETKVVEGFYMKPNLSKLQRKHPEYKVDFARDPKGNIIDYSARKTGFDWTQFEWMLRQLNKEMADPAAKAVKESLRRQGFLRHGLKRKGVKGSLGTEGGMAGLRKFEEVSENYIRHAYDFMANRKLDRLYNMVEAMPEANHMPHTKAWNLEAIQAATGKGNHTAEALSEALSGLISGTIRVGTLGKVHLSRRFTRDVLQGLNKAGYALVLGFGLPVFLGAQILQPTFMAPKMLSMARRSGLNRAVVARAVAKAENKYLKGVLGKDADAKKLDSIGAFDALQRYDWSTYAGDVREYKRMMSEHLTGLSLMQGVESMAVRRPAAHMFLEILREIGYEKVAKDPMEIYHVAREMTDHYMVSTRFYEKPHVFSRTGLAGMAVSPLKSFATTWLGMLLEYSATSAKGDVVPLAAFAAINVMTAGLINQIGIKEWDLLAKFLNEQFGFNIPTGSETVLSGVKNDKLAFGLLSDATGYNVGSTFGSPAIPELISPGIGLQLGERLANLAYQGAKSTGVFGEENIPQQSEMREAFKGVAPRMMHGQIERMFTPEGMPYAERSGQAGPISRTPEDWRARDFGTFTLKEAKEKTEWYTAYRLQKKLTKHVDRMVDVLINKHQVRPDSIDRLITGLVDKGFTGQEINSALQREILSRLLEADVRGVKGGTARAGRLLLLLEQLGGTNVSQ